MKRWSIFIDVEGFSSLHRTSDREALRRLNNLMEDIYQIGTKIFNRDPKRLFVHQLGDGFVIISSFPEEDLNRPISIALALMKSALLNGGIGKVSISDGDFTDIQGTWPKVIKNNINDRGNIFIGEGKMTLFTVMGDALINSHKAIEKANSGPHFVIDRRLENFVPSKIKITKETRHLLYINWIKNHTDISKDILDVLGHTDIESNKLKALLSEYLYQNDLPSKWKKAASAIIQNG